MFESYEARGEGAASTTHLFAPFIDDSEFVSLMEEEKEERRPPAEVPRTEWRSELGSLASPASSPVDDMIPPCRSFDSRDGSLSGDPLGMIPKCGSHEWSGPAAQQGLILKADSKDWGAIPSAEPPLITRTNESQLEDLLSILASQVASPAAASSARREGVPPVVGRSRSEESSLESGSDVDDSSSSSGDDNNNISNKMRSSKRRKKRRQERMSPEAKAELTRQRNREHARSTRRRKKQYVEQLKKQVADLLAKQHLLNSLEAPPLEAEQADLRGAVVQTFLIYRVTRVVDRDRWRDIVDDHVRATLPRTPYRCEPRTQHQSPPGTRRLKGIDGLVRDAISVGSMVDMVRQRAKVLRRRPEPPDVELRCTVEPRDLILVADRVLCRWTAATNGLRAAGLPAELCVDGFCKAAFHNHKLRDIEITFDALSVSAQLIEADLMDLSILAADAVVDDDRFLPPPPPPPQQTTTTTTAANGPATGSPAPARPPPPPLLPPILPPYPAAPPYFGMQNHLYLPRPYLPQGCTPPFFPPPLHLPPLHAANLLHHAGPFHHNYPPAPAPPLDQTTPPPPPPSPSILLHVASSAPSSSP